MKLFEIRLVSVTALCLLAGSIRAQIVINEIMYHPPSPDPREEYIELYNSGDQPVDLSSWSFTKGIKFKFDAGTEIPANGFKLVEQYDDLPWQHVMFFERDEDWKGPAPQN